MLITCGYSLLYTVRVARQKHASEQARHDQVLLGCFGDMYDGSIDRIQESAANAGSPSKPATMSKTATQELARHAAVKTGHQSITTAPPRTSLHKKPK